jgi:protein TonB
MKFKVIALLLAGLFSCTSVSLAQSDDKVYQIVDIPATFPGGTESCMKYIASHLEYPQKALEKGVQGKVTVGFTVEIDGSITDIGVVKSVDPDLDAEAMRIFSKMPNWQPGELNGQKVRCECYFPVIFKLR